uniref:Uncharacterized protein n=1 Tax=viral metagenome TaxID=1070528 RepID=A0A6M3LTA7_9ZZZZ
MNVKLFVKRWVLPGVWLIIVTFGTYYLFFTQGPGSTEILVLVEALVIGGIILAYAYLLWKQG